MIKGCHSIVLLYSLGSLPWFINNYKPHNRWAIQSFLQTNRNETKVFAAHVTLFQVGSFWSGAVYTMGTCHKGLLGNLGAKDGAFGKYLGPQKMGRNRTRKAQALKQDGRNLDLWLGGGNSKIFGIFTPNLGEMIQFD